jgi:predicted naringenin-chalcone synthase
MVLSGQVPARTQAALRASAGEILADAQISSVGFWAVHPGGRTILDAVQHAFDLRPEALLPSRDVLRKFGNMSSATILFVLQRALGGLAGVKGCGMAFGPGMTAETMLFHTA